MAILEAAAQAGLPTSAFNAGRTVTNGAGWFQINSGADNTRMSSSHAYLHPIIDSRPNLEIRTHCWASKVLFDEQRRAIGVDYLSPDLLTHTTVIARREVVLSAGAIDTPKLLMLSGIGPGEHLREFAIDVLVDAPGVGSNLDDHVEGIVQWDARKPMIRTSTQWWEIGLFSTSQPGLDRPDLMMHYGSVPFDMNTARWGYPTTENGFCLTPNVCRGRSRGTVRLRSRDYRDRARVDPRYFTDPEGHDEQVMLYGVRLARKIVSQPAMTEWAAGELAPGADAQSDDEIIDYIHKTHNTVYHPACTARMGPDGDRDAVLDPRLSRARRPGPARGRRIGDALPAGHQPVHHDDDDRREVRRDDAPGRPGDDAGERGGDAQLTATPDPGVADFLRLYPPFDALQPDAVARVAAVAELEHHPAGTTIFSQGAEPVSHLRVVRSGAVELVLDGRTLDLLGVGELFGQTSMLSGLPTGFTARAHEETTCLRIPADVARATLGRPEALRYLSRSLLDRGRLGPAREQATDPADQPVEALVRRPLVVCAPDTTIREAARRMSAAGATCVVVDSGGEGLGILTDRDLRTRVVADGMSADEPVAAAMTTPAVTVSADRTGALALLDMLDRGIRHLPVVSATGRVLGRRRGRRPRGRRGAHAVSPARGDRAGAHRRRARAGRARAAPDDRGAAPRARRSAAHRRRPLGGGGRAHAAAHRPRRRRGRSRSRSPSPGWRWAASRGARRRRGPTSRAPSPCRATRTTTRSSSTPSRSAAASRSACAPAG